MIDTDWCTGKQFHLLNSTCTHVCIIELFKSGACRQLNIADLTIMTFSLKHAHFSWGNFPKLLMHAVYTINKCTRDANRVNRQEPNGYSPVSLSLTFSILNFFLSIYFKFYVRIQ